jgi:hypothetical protein
MAERLGEKAAVSQLSLSCHAIVSDESSKGTGECANCPSTNAKDARSKTCGCRYVVVDVSMSRAGARVAD